MAIGLVDRHTGGRVHSDRIDKIHLVLVSARFIPKEAEIVGGSVELLINGAFSKQFKIPNREQTATSMSSLNPGFNGIFLYATNSDLP